MASLGNDLATIRKHKGLSLESMYQVTKIPLVTLKRIENDSIFDEREENPTYIRSFVRSYAKALRIHDDIIVKALDQRETGNYNNLLVEQIPGLGSPESPPVSTEQRSGESEEVPELIPETDTRQPEHQGKVKDRRDSPPPPTVSSVNWVELGQKFIINEKNSSLWIVGTVMLFLLLIAAAWFLYTQNYFGSGNIGTILSNQAENSVLQPQSEAGPGHADLNLELRGDTPEDAVLQPPAPELDETLYITVYAAYNRLDPVRIWSDMKPQMDPYWLDQGVAYHYEFRDTIRIRGQYSQMLIFLNGHRIDNFRQEYFNVAENAVELTREMFSEDPKWTDSVSLELPENVQEPTLIQHRPTF